MRSDLFSAHSIVSHNNPAIPAPKAGPEYYFSEQAHNFADEPDLALESDRIDMNHLAILTDLRLRIERCAASIEDLEHALDSHAPEANRRRAVIRAVVRFDTNDLTLQAVLSALVECN